MRSGGDEATLIFVTLTPHPPSTHPPLPRFLQVGELPVSAITSVSVVVVERCWTSVVVVRRGAGGAGRSDGDYVWGNT